MNNHVHPVFRNILNTFADKGVKVKKETLYVDGFPKVTVGGAYATLISRELLDQVSQWQTYDPLIDCCIEQQLADGTMRVSHLEADAQWSEWEHQDQYGNVIEEVEG